MSSPEPPLPRSLSTRLSSGVIGSATVTLSLTVPGFSTDTIVPTAVTVLANSKAVYVAAYDKSAYNPGGTTTSNANPGWLFGYAVGSGGAMTADSGSPYQAGVKPSAVTTDPISRFVYVTDFASNQLIGYTVLSSDALQFMINGPFRTGNQPTSIVIDPRGIFVYLTNSLDETVSAYSIALPTGTPSADVGLGGVGASTTDTDPVSIIVDPAGAFLFTPPTILATPSPASSSIQATEPLSRRRPLLIPPARTQPF